MIRFPRLGLGVLAAGTVVFGAAGFAGSASAQTAAATVTVIHGVPGATVDVCANGSAAIRGFTFKSQKTLSLPAGTYSLGIVKAGQACTQTNYLASASATLTAGENASIIAYLNASGTPTLGAYANDTSAVPAGQGRLVLSHNAQAPGVNVVVGTTSLASGLTSGNQASVVVPAKAYSPVDVVVAGTTTKAISGATVPVAADMDTIVYVVGNTTAGYSAIVQTVGLGMPTSVVTGNSPVGSHSELPLAGLIALLGVAAAVGLFSARALRAARAGH